MGAACLGRQPAPRSKAGVGSHSGPFGSAWAGGERSSIQRLSGSRSAFSGVLLHLKESQSASTLHRKECNISGNKLQAHFQAVHRCMVCLRPKAGAKRAGDESWGEEVKGRRKRRRWQELEGSSGSEREPRRGLRQEGRGKQWASTSPRHYFH